MKRESVLCWAAASAVVFAISVASAADDASTLKTVTTKAIDVQLYGTIKLDSSYDDSRASAGNFARWV